jgi:uncharacterized membrane protein YheB (UPF0754 family)
MYSFLFAVFVGGFIGYITNLIAVKALFHPRKPVKLLLWDYQGLMPKRHQELADNVGRLVEGELINIEEILKKIKPEDLDPFVKKLSKQIRDNIELDLRSWVAGMAAKIPFVNISVNTLVTQTMDKGEKEINIIIKKQVPSLLDTAGKEIKENLSIQDIVTEKIAGMDIIKVEELFDRIAKKEMQAIVWLGGILGMAVGAIQFLAQKFWLIPMGF